MRLRRSRMGGFRRSSEPEDQRPSLMFKETPSSKNLPRISYGEPLRHAPGVDQLQHFRVAAARTDVQNFRPECSRMLNRAPCPRWTWQRGRSPLCDSPTHIGGMPRRRTSCLCLCSCRPCHFFPLPLPAGAGWPWPSEPAATLVLELLPGRV